MSKEMFANCKCQLWIKNHEQNGKENKKVMKFKISILFASVFCLLVHKPVFSKRFQIRL